MLTECEQCPWKEFMSTVSRDERSASPCLRSVELFTGAGGLAIGTHNAGFRHEALVEWNADAVETVRENVAGVSVRGIHDWNVIQADVRLLDYRALGHVDLVAGGPPCQPFSIGGKHHGREDERDMIPEFIRAIRELTPAAFILENVKGLTRQSFKNYFSYVQLQLTHPTLARRPGEQWLEHLARLEDAQTNGRRRDLHYNVVARLLNAANYGVPQTRERVFLVGFRSDVGVEWHFPEATHSRDSLLHVQWVKGDYWESRGIPRPRHVPTGVSARLRRLSSLWAPSERPWCTLRDAVSDLPEPSEHRESPDVANHRLQPGARRYPGHTGSHLDWPCKTLKAGVHGVPGGENMMITATGRVRYLTIRESARVQTFPDRWVFRGAWSEAMRQLGNAVPMRLAEVVAKSVARKLRD